MNLVSPDADLNSVRVAAISDVRDMEAPRPTEEELTRQVTKNLLIMIAAIPYEGLKSHLLDCFAHPETVGPNMECWYAPKVRLGQIKSWRETLRKIAAHQRYIVTSITTEFDYETGECRDLKDDLSAALDKMDFRNIRACKVCGRIYFAPRLIYKGIPLVHCSSECRKALRRKEFAMLRVNLENKSKKRRKQK